MIVTIVSIILLRIFCRTENTFTTRILQSNILSIVSRILSQFPNIFPVSILRNTPALQTIPSTNVFLLPFLLSSTHAFLKIATLLLSIPLLTISLPFEAIIFDKKFSDPFLFQSNITTFTTLFVEDHISSQNIRTIFRILF